MDEVVPKPVTIKKIRNILNEIIEEE